MSLWHKYNVADIALEFGTDVKNGKTNVKPDRKRRGDNNVFLLPTVDSKFTVKKLASEASLILLATVYVLVSFLGRALEACIGLVVLFTVFCISYSIRIASSKRVVNSYRLLMPTAKVIESGIKIRLSAFDVEVGDLIEFSQGDVIPADARIVFADNLAVLERYVDLASGKISYRREEKNHEPSPSVEDGADSYSNMVYAASIVVAGKGRAIVTETGSDTKLSGKKSEMKIVSDDDVPEYLSRFLVKAKRTSLFSFIFVIPLTLVSLIRKAPVAAEGGDFDLLYSFLLLLALAVTCMSEIIISPAESLVTKELLVSSRKDKVRKNTESRITKLSSAEAIADTDTVLVLSSDVLLDKRFMVRRVFFADKTYRFDTLKSEDLAAFYELIVPIIVHSKNDNLSKEMLAVKSFLEDNQLFSVAFESYSFRPRFLRNFPTDGARACVFESDENGKPTKCIFYTNDSAQVEKCTEFRTEGGGLWKTDRDTIKKIYNEYDNFLKIGLTPVMFISLNKNRTIFEGMIGVGSEYPFTDGSLAEEFYVSGIQTIFFFDKENSGNLSLIYESGFVENETEVAVASEYLRNGMSITDAPISTKAYIGFNRSEVSKLTDRLIRNGRRILPIIKDSADRRGIVPLSVYATHSIESYDSIKISSSLLIQPADADTRKGGIYDVLKMIRGSSMARLKLGVYKNYLAFSMFLRAVAICCAMLIGRAGSGITTLMVLSMGFLCDGIAVLSLMMSKGIPVKPKDAVLDAKTLFSPTLFLFFSIAGTISGITAYAVTETLLSLGKLPLLCAPSFFSYVIIFSQVVSLGGFLVILNMRSRRRALNWAYLVFISVAAALMVVQNFLPTIFYKFLNCLNIYRFSINLVPFAVLISMFALVTVLLISKLLSSFSRSKIK